MAPQGDKGKGKEYFFSMLVTKKDREEVYQYLFKEGVMVARKDFKNKHSRLDVPNIVVLELMRSFVSRSFVKEQYAWRHYYWYLTNEGIEYLRTYLHLPAEIVPSTLKKTTRAPQTQRPAEGERPPRMGRGGGFGGGRDEYRKAQPAPGEFNPTFGGGGGTGFGRGAVPAE